MKLQGQEFLHLEDYEDTKSRFVFLKLPRERMEMVLGLGIVRLGHSAQERMLWEHLLKDDLVLAMSLDPKKLLVACRVASKGTAFVSKEHGDASAPLLLFVEVVGCSTHFRLTADSFFFSDFMLGPNRFVFNQLWSQCEKDERIPKWDAFGSRALDSHGYRVTFASTHDDYSEIARLARHHPFGSRRALLNLIARRDGVVMGAVLADVHSDVTVPIRAAWRIFRSDLLGVRKNAVTVARIYTDPRLHFRWGLHKALLQAVLSISPSIVDGTLTIVEGVSYDYHPVALSLGFHVEVPHSIEGAFYYWKPVNVPEHVETSRPPHRQVIRDVKQLLQARKNLKYWIAPARKETIQLALDKGSWAITWTHNNVGYWRMLRKGDFVFLMSEDYSVEAWATVGRTENVRVRGLDRFPLWIHFEPHSLVRTKVDLSEFLNEQWLYQFRSGGLVPLGGELGAEVHKRVTAQTQRGAMIVRPNPFLLRRTEFVMTAGQVFVVQAWRLRDTVLPVIRGILQEHGYVTKYSGDRDGPVIFEDIWTLMNESEAVIVDFTDKRPNVYLEYGMALVLGKPIVAITQSADDLPSDTPQLKYILYEDRLGDAALRLQLPRAIQTNIADVQLATGRL